MSRSKNDIPEGYESEYLFYFKATSLNEDALADFEDRLRKYLIDIPEVEVVEANDISEHLDVVKKDM